MAYDIKKYWNEDLTTFVLGCSMSFELPLIELDVDVMQIPEMESDADISLPSTYFAGIINQLEIFGDTIEFSCNEDKIILNSLSVESGIRLSAPDTKISSSSSLVIGLDTD